MGRRREQRVRIVKFPWGDPSGLVQAVRSLVFAFGPQEAGHRLIALGRDVEGYGIFCYTMSKVNEQDLRILEGLSIIEPITRVMQNRGVRTVHGSGAVITDLETNSVIDALLRTLFGCDQSILRSQDCDLRFAAEPSEAMPHLLAEAVALAS